MATRFYFSGFDGTQVPSPEVSPGFDGGWGGVQGLRTRLLLAPDNTVWLSVPMFGGGTEAANATYQAAQFVSPRMASGVAFTTGQTASGVILAIELAATANLNRQPLSLRVVSADGASPRATLLTLAHYGPSTTEWNTTAQNRQLAQGVGLQANYTTVTGDRLVLEIGGQVDGTGGTSVQGQFTLGAQAATALAEDETSQSFLNPWFEVSTDITWLLTGEDHGVTCGTQYAPGPTRGAWG